MSDKRTRNRTLTITFCLVSILTALDQQITLGAASAAGTNSEPSTSEPSRTFGGLSWMRPELVRDTPEDSFSLRLHPDFQDATASELLISPHSGLLKRTAGTSTLTGGIFTGEFSFDSPASALMARLSGAPAALAGGGSASPPANPVIGAPPESECTPQDRANASSACYRGEAPVPPQTVPEPPSMALVALGFLAVAAASRLSRL
jgi:PEP-CTERM motif